MGNLVVYPDQYGTDAHDGSRVIIVSTIGNRVPVSLEVIRERVTTPYSSDLALAVGARRRVERCSVRCNGRMLLAPDSQGIPQAELPLPVGSYLYFRIPEEMDMESDTIVEVLDGINILRRERFRNIIGAADTYKPRRSC